MNQTTVINNVAELQLPETHLVQAVAVASEKKAKEITLLAIKDVAEFTDYFMLCSARSTRQVQAIADEVLAQLESAGRRPLHVEGYQAAEWVLVDYGDFVVHIFTDQARRFYDLERLWRDVSRIELHEQ
jgi:ribosome-associated protein